MVYDLPLSNIAEVTLVGTGGGYGESIVIHYGLNQWAVVDSCIDPLTNSCLPLAYLQQIGVNVATDVKIILCTHWHDDHIRGLSKLLEICTSAEFFFARATDCRKFLAWIGMDFQKVDENSTLSSTKEFKKCIDVALKYKMQVKQVGPDRLLESIPKLSVNIWSLSPSDTTLNNFDAEIGQLIDKYGVPGIKYVRHTPNDKSVALLLSLGYHTAILGADLEVSSDNQTGWLNILDFSKVVRDVKANLFKIPHHGSQNGFHERIWGEILQNSPIAKMTPWNKNGGLPTADMVRLYKTKTSELYITSSGKEKIFIKRDKSFTKMLDKFNVKIKEIRYAYGLVRSRVDMTDSTANWDVEVVGEGCKL